MLELAAGVPDSITGEIIGKAYAAGDQLATELLTETIEMLALWLSNMIDLLDPDVIVIGGGVGNIDAIYTEGLNSLKQFIFNNRVDVPIVKPSLGDSAGVFGAAALVA